MHIEQAVPNPGFARHETFHLRFGWLKKCYDGTSQDERVFQSEDALVRLGVGKNMVRAIRFWGIAAKIIRQKVEPGEESRRGSQEVEVTEMGRRIFDGKTGLDPYLERPETLWLLHWLIYAPPSSIPAWWVIMNDLSAVRVPVGELPGYVRGKVSTVDTWAIPNETSIKKDTDAFVHTYASKRDNIGDMEDYMDCPFRALRIVKADTSAKSTIQFSIGIKPGMSADIVAYICLDFLNRLRTESRTVSVNYLTTEPGGPGHVLKLDEPSLTKLLTEASKVSGRSIKVYDVNGVAHISFPKDIMKEATQILEQIYATDKTRVRRKAPKVVMRARK